MRFDKIKKAANTSALIVFALVQFAIYIAPAVITVAIIVHCTRSCESTKTEIANQKIINNLDHIYNEIEALYKDKNYTQCRNKCYEYIKKCDELSYSHDDIYSYKAYMMLSILSYESGDLSSSKEYAQRLIDIVSSYSIDQLKDVGDDAYYIPYSIMCNIAKQQGDYELLETCMNNLIALAYDTENEQMLPNMLLGYGHMEAYLHNYNKAEELYRNIIDNATKYKNTEEYQKCRLEAISSLIAIYVTQQNYDEAFKVYNELDLSAADAAITKNTIMTSIAMAKIYNDDIDGGSQIINKFIADEIAACGQDGVEYVLSRTSGSRIKLMIYLKTKNSNTLEDVKASYMEDCAFWTKEHCYEYPNEYLYFVMSYREWLERCDNYNELLSHCENLMAILKKHINSTEYVDIQILHAECLVATLKLEEAKTISLDILSNIQNNPLLVSQQIDIALLLSDIYAKLGYQEKCQEMNDMAYRCVIEHKYADIQNSDPNLFTTALKGLYDNSIIYGDYQRALEICKIIEKYYDKMNVSSAQIKVQQALAYRGLHDADNIIISCSKALELANNNTIRYFASELLGYGHMMKGEYQIAEKHLLSAYAYSDEITPSEKDMCLKDIAMLYTLWGKYNKASQYASLINGDNIEELLLIAWRNSDTISMERLLVQYYESLISDIQKVSTNLSSDQLSTYAQNRLSIDIIPAMAASNPNSVICSKYAYNSALNLKGLSLKSMTELIQYIRESNIPLLNNQLDDILSMYNALTKENNTTEIERIRKNIEQNEKDLYSRVQNIDNDILRVYDYSDVAKQLAHNDVAIEFVKCDIYKYKSYIALIIRKDWNSPKVIEICKIEDLENIIKIDPSSPSYRKDATSEDRLIQDYYCKGYDLIWASIAPYINSGDNVYFSPDGLLHQMNIELLQDADRRQVNEKWNINRVSSTREICNTKPTTTNKTAVLYGYLTYQMNDEELVEQSRRYNKHNVQSRSLLPDTTNTRSKLYRLPSTKDEIMAIEKICKHNNIKVKSYTDVYGNEESFKSLSGLSPTVIHLATHGFFLKNDDYTNKAYYQQTNNRTIFTYDTSLKRSGIILAGAHKSWIGGHVPNNIEDGILLAEEIASMDLTGTDLVVLSACDTGLGEITSEGVFGLQRAFKKAGVQTLIMSLWKVDDRATSLFMKTFYEYWLNGKTKHEAFTIAQRTVREHEGYSNPYYWAGFIMLD